MYVRTSYVHHLKAWGHIYTGKTNGYNFNLDDHKLCFISLLLICFFLANIMEKEKKRKSQQSFLSHNAVEKSAMILNKIDTQLEWPVLLPSELPKFFMA